MASTISAGTTSGTALNMSGDTSGNLAFQTQAGANTITIANQTGTLNAAGPAFSAYANAAQTLTAITFTKLQANTEEFDTNSNYDTTNYRFTPTVAGYYQITGGASFTTAQTSELLITIYKNNARFKAVYDVEASSWGGFGTALVYANGTTDYFELYLYSASTGTKTTSPGARDCYFQACLVRGA